MNISFKYRFILSFVILEIIFLTMIALVNFNNINKNYNDFEEYKESSLKSLGKQLLATPLSIYDISTIDNIINEFTKFKGVVAMKVWDSNKTLLAQSNNKIEIKNDFQVLNSKIKIDNTIVGEFTIWIDLSFLKSTIKDNKQKTIMIILLEILVSSILSWIIGHNIAKSLNKLTENAISISNDLNVNIPKVSGAKEVKLLSDTLIKMRNQLLIDRHEINHYNEIIDKDVITSRTDLKGKITYASKAFCEISGYTEEELLGKNHNIVRHTDMPKKLYEGLWNTIKENKVWHGEIKNLRKDGTSYWVETRISPWYDKDAKKIGYIAIRHDITDKKIIQQISITDGLTHIYNRRHFNELFPKIINSAKRNNTLVSFIIMDIDHFKQYNDTYGHQKGDKVLIKVAKAIKDLLKRADDYCFRLGGEEFGVIFKSNSKEMAEKFATHIKENIENLHIEHKKNSASEYITVSMGLVCRNANEIQNDEEIYKKGDTLLYKSKESGRNKVSVEE